MSFAVAILGRPNVGKSTLFNRLVGRRLALVDNTPGVTRDRREGEGRIADLVFRLVDTAGLEEAPPDSLSGRMQAQTARALDDADVGLLLIDAREGVTEADRHFAGWLRHAGKPVVLVANKAEGRAALAGIGEAYRLGLGDPVPVSAEHGEGLAELYERLAPFFRAHELSPSEQKKVLQLAIVGRPNVGKSTLVNRLLAEERLLTGPEAGITRDAITIDWVWRDRAVRLIDTAGLRRKPKIDSRLEQLSVGDALRAIRFAETVILVIDSLQPLERQDLTIARLVAEEGRALVLAANKWDAIDKPAELLKHLRERVSTSLPQLHGIAVVAISALSGLGVDSMMEAVVEAYEVWNRRVSTADLNRWLAAALERHPPPLVAGRRLSLRYITQVNTRPPTFALFVSKPIELADSYRRYLVNSLRENFDLPGTPIRMMLRKGANPYQPRRARQG
ncbi:MAG: ribosome biogenesis GTPase Der [Alphaproteobacteria bacterium]|nr:ribosome biogenesis GTPase Der [Alphaproteobacteria bacterium]